MRSDPAQSPSITAGRQHRLPGALQPSVMMKGSAGHPEMVVMRPGLPKGKTWYEEESEVFTVITCT